MNTPYNTGKVRIGENYHPAVRRSMSDDELKIQRALLDTPTADESYMRGHTQHPFLKEDEDLVRLGFVYDTLTMLGGLAVFALVCFAVGYLS